MADLLIKGMEMPKTCAWRENKGGCLHNCFLYYYCHAHSVYTYKENDERPSDCPLVEVEKAPTLVDVRSAYCQGHNLYIQKGKAST